MNKTSLAWLLGFGFGLVSTSMAADGQIDLRIDPAIGATIDRPGGYVVVENVTMTANVPAITVTAADVTIDLGGHVLTGMAGGSAEGISAPGADSLRVSNGSIRGFGGDGIEAGDDGRFENLSIGGCGGWGALAGDAAEFHKLKLKGNDIGGNTGGIFGGDQCVVTDSIIAGNEPATGYTNGIRLADEARVERCRVTQITSNTSFALGIYVDGESAVIGNSIQNVKAAQGAGVSQAIRAGAASVALNNNVSYCNGYNGVIGIQANDGSVVEGNAITYLSNNGSGTLIGITVGGNGVIRGNTTTYNYHNGTGSAWGISAGFYSTIVNNTSTNNREGLSSASTAYGIEAGFGSLIAGNTCNSNQSNGSNGSGRGIKAGSNCEVRENVCSMNNGAGTGNAAAIEAGDKSRVINNHCTDSTGGVLAHGIRAAGTGILVSGNYCSGNTTGGLFFNAATDNRSESNRFRQTVGIDTVNGALPEAQGAAPLDDKVY